MNAREKLIREGSTTSSKIFPEIDDMYINSAVWGRDDCFAVRWDAYRLLIFVGTISGAQSHCDGQYVDDDIVEVWVDDTKERDDSDVLAAAQFMGMTHDELRDAFAATQSYDDYIESIEEDE